MPSATAITTFKRKRKISARGKIRKRKMRRMGTKTLPKKKA